MTGSIRSPSTRSTTSRRQPRQPRARGERELRPLHRPGALVAVEARGPGVGDDRVSALAERGLDIQHLAVDVALLAEHGLAVGCDEDGPERVATLGHDLARHAVGMAQVALELLVPQRACARADGRQQCASEPRRAQPVVRFSSHEKSSYIAIAITPMVTRPAKASDMRCWLPAVCIR